MTYVHKIVFAYLDEVETLDDGTVDAELDVEILKGSSRIIFSFVDVEKVYKYSGRS